MHGSSSETAVLRPRPLIPALALAGFLAGCGGTDYEYRSAREIPPGRGLFTGAQGALTIGLGGGEAAEGRPPAPREGLPAARPPAGYAEP